jgi:cobyrinic acid a,c-diamide synthase
VAGRTLSQAGTSGQGRYVPLRVGDYHLGPRVVIAGTSSGVGKTSVATGLLAALRAAGHRPAAAKVGPDFIDPGYHAVATGRPPRNLDAWICGPGAVAPLAARAASGADLLVVEGVMGLFDRASDGAPSSTADVATLLQAPVVLVVDASRLSDSVAAVLSGFAGWDPAVRVAGVVLNRVGSDAHEAALRRAVEPVGVPVLGSLRRDERFAWRDRHLGLVPVAEQPDVVAAAVDRLARAVGDQVDLDGIVRLASRAPRLATGPVPLPAPARRPLRVAVAAGRAFTFTYTDTLEALAAGGAEAVPFDPLHDDALPAGVAGLVAGGGFPEVHSEELASNRTLLHDVARRVEAGLVTWAECGGLLWLARSLDGRPMAGVVPCDGRMTAALTLGYARARTTTRSPLGPPGTGLRGHEFHYSVAEPPGSALELEGRQGRRHDGWATPGLLATYLHHHPGGDPGAVAGFLEACTLSGSSR